MTAVALRGIPRDYAWGSTTLIQRLTGRPVDGRPLAELWLGAHPDDPSEVQVAGGAPVALDAFIDTDPVAILGPRSVARFGPQLPFLLKLLAADRALSIQVHPTLAQAHAGFAAEDDEDVPRDSPQRTYRDANHKPELICALTPFRALCGFRAPARTAELIAALPGAAGALLADVQADLAGPDEPAALRSAFTRLLETPDADRAGLVGAVASGAEALLDGFWDEAARAVLTAAQDYPGDIGIAVSLLLNPVTLQPGQALFLGAGNVHAYLRGLGVEIMANSDNVLRCGLTAKHIDVPELLRVTRFEALPDPLWAPDVAGEGAVRFDVPVPDFALTRADLPEAADVETAGPRIVLCTEGAVETGGIRLGPGDAAFVPNGVPAPLHGRGTAFIASTGG